MPCEMCGSDSDLFNTIVEGSTLKVCKECAKFGKVLKKVEKHLPKKAFKAEQTPEQPEIIETVVDDFSSIIRKKREEMNLKQDDFAKKINEKSSLVYSLENGKTRPSIALARKLEKLLNIRLIEEIKDTKIDLGKRDDSGELTIGDLIKVKKR